MGKHRRVHKRENFSSLLSGGGELPTAEIRKPQDQCKNGPRNFAIFVAGWHDPNAVGRRHVRQAMQSRRWSRRVDFERYIH